LSKLEIDQYIAQQREPEKTLLKNMRKMILEIEPELKQGITYGTGCSFYPFSGSVLAALNKDLVIYKQTKSALHFDSPLPKTLVRKLMNQRMVQIMIKRKGK